VLFETYFLGVKSFLFVGIKTIAVSTMSHKFSHVTDHYSTLLCYLHQWVKKKLAKVDLSYGFWESGINDITTSEVVPLGNQAGTKYKTKIDPSKLAPIEVHSYKCCSKNMDLAEILIC